jgi:UPF0716 protein FxsA
MGALALFVFLVLPIAEIFVAFTIADAIGGFATVVLLLVTSIAGGAIVRRAGARAWAELQAAAAAGRPPRDVVDNAIVLVGGLLLLVPGFITDAIGLLFLVPFTRRLSRWLVAGFVARRVKAAREYARRRGSFRRSPYDDVIEGEVVDETPSPPQRDRPDQIGRAG